MLRVALLVAAVAGGQFNVVSTVRVEHKASWMRTELGARLQSPLGGWEPRLFLVPRLRFGSGQFDVGPELRIPLYGGNYKLLLKSEGKL